MRLIAHGQQRVTQVVQRIQYAQKDGLIGDFAAKRCHRLTVFRLACINFQAAQSITPLWVQRTLNADLVSAW